MGNGAVMLPNHRRQAGKKFYIGTTRNGSNANRLHRCTACTMSYSKSYFWTSLLSYSTLLHRPTLLPSIHGRNERHPENEIAVDLQERIS